MIKNGLRLISTGLTSIQTTLRGCNSTSAKLPGNGKCVRQLVSYHYASTKECFRFKSTNGTVPPMPWFGIDIGGTLSKIVFFEPKDSNTTQTEDELLSNVTKYLTKNSAYGKSGHRDAYLQACINFYYLISTVLVFTISLFTDGQCTDQQ
ncbi:pantothenate kinase 1-like [Metopolophium dirhodum]|uniref:pantothenate kinase 1-like n=1 Tax=Metopolophium dirhodum TaxID=44670 RepID=UPI00298FB03C|nr:pantothenate kinase 1-like [Metopolophium dirhodum]